MKHDGQPPTGRSADSPPGDHCYLEEDQVYERYLQGRLPSDEAQRFERHYLDCTYCLEQLETSEALLDGLRRAAVEDAVTLETGRRLVMVSRLRQRLPHLTWAAVSLGLLLLTVWSGWRASELGSQMERLQEQRRAWSAPLAVVVPALRGNWEDTDTNHPRLLLPGEESILEFVLPLGLPPGGRYALRLETADGDAVWQADDLGANDDGELRVQLSSARLSPGILVVRVWRQSVEGPEVARLRLDIEASG